MLAGALDGMLAVVANAADLGHGAALHVVTVQRLELRDDEAIRLT
jgi:hypothetical protein